MEWSSVHAMRFENVPPTNCTCIVPLKCTAFVFSVAGALVVWEYDKSKKKEKLKELKTEKEHQEQDDRIAKLEDRLVSLEDSIRANLNSILEQQRLSVEPEIKRRRGWLW